VIALLFYANLVALNLIVVSQLSMYAAAAVAAVLTVIALALSFLGKRNPSASRDLDKPLIQPVETVKPGPSLVQLLSNMQKNQRPVKPEINKNSYLETSQSTVQSNGQPETQPKVKSSVQIESRPIMSQKVKQQDSEKSAPTPQGTEDAENGKLADMKKTPQTVKSEVRRNSYLQTKQPMIKVSKQSQPSTQAKEQSTVQIEEQPTKPQTVRQPDSEKSAPTPQETNETKSGKLKCQNCSKEFSQPILMADYSDPNSPDLVPHCPYCFKPLSSKQKVTKDEEAWKKYV